MKDDEIEVQSELVHPPLRGLHWKLGATMAGLALFDGYDTFNLRIQPVDATPRICVSSGGVANEAEAEDLLFRDAEGTHVGSLAQGRYYS